MEIDINKTPLSEENYDEFMKVLDVEFRNQYKNQINDNYSHSETQYKAQWLADDTGNTVQEMIDNEVSHWEED